jgi:hypothetical protein
MHQVMGNYITVKLDEMTEFLNTYAVRVSKHTLHNP